MVHVTLEHCGTCNDEAGDHSTTADDREGEPVEGYGYRDVWTTKPEENAAGPFWTSFLSYDLHPPPAIPHPLRIRRLRNHGQNVLMQKQPRGRK